MRKIVFLLFLTFIISSFTTTEKTDSFNIVGKWTGKDESNNEGSFIFDKDGYAIMIKEGQSMGGKEFELEGIKASMQYAMDENSNPIKFDIIITALKNQKSKSMRMLMKIVNKNKIILASNFNEIRPTSFTKSNSIILERE